MTTTINADNGAISGTAGLKQTADSSGVLALQTNGTTAISISTAQVVSFTNPLPGSTGASLVLIQRQTPSAVATCDFTTGIDSTYDEYLFTLTDVLPATDGAGLRGRVSEDAGSNFKAGGSDYAYETANVTAGAWAVSSSNGADHARLSGGVGSAAAKGISGEVRLFAPSGTANNKKMTSVTTAQDAAARGFNVSGCVYVGTTNAVNGFRFLFSSGNITSGTIALYGVRKS